MVKPFSRASWGLLREEYPLPVFTDLSMVVEYVARGVKLLILFNCSVDDECTFLSSSRVVVFDDFEPANNAGVCSREKLPKSDFSKSVLDVFFLSEFVHSCTY